MTTMEYVGWAMTIVSLAILIRWAWKRAGQDQTALRADDTTPLDVLLTEDDVEDDANEPDAMRAREQETAELEDLLKLPAFERGQA